MLGYACPSNSPPTAAPSFPSLDPFQKTPFQNHTGPHAEKHKKHTKRTKRPSIPCNPSGLLPTLPPRSSCPTDLRAPLSLPPCGPPSLFCHPTDLQPSFYPPTDLLRFFLFASLSCLLMVLALTHKRTQKAKTLLLLRKRPRTQVPSSLSLSSPPWPFYPSPQSGKPPRPLALLQQDAIKDRETKPGWARLPALPTSLCSMQRLAQSHSLCVVYGH